MDDYPIDKIVAALRTAGWNGKAAPGWLFNAHVAAEHHMGPGPVAACLMRRLQVRWDFLTEPAMLIDEWTTKHGAAPRKLIDIVEATISGKVTIALRSGENT